MAEAWEPIRKQRSRREVRRPELREMVVAMGGSQGNLRGTWEVNEEKLRPGRLAWTGCRMQDGMQKEAEDVDGSVSSVGKRR